MLLRCTFGRKTGQNLGGIPPKLCPVLSFPPKSARIPPRDIGIKTLLHKAAGLLQRPTERLTRLTNAHAYNKENITATKTKITHNERLTETYRNEKKSCTWGRGVDIDDLCV